MESAEVDRVLISIPPIIPTLAFVINSFDKSMLEDGSVFGD